MKDWRDINIGETYRIRNDLGQELDRTVISVDEKRVVFQRAEVEEGILSDIATKRFISYYNKCGIPYVAGQYGDRLAAELDPDFDWEEEKQLTMF